MSPAQPLWAPSPEAAANSSMARFMRHAGNFGSYEELHGWSLRQSADFWRLLWDFGGLVGDPGGRVLLNADRMPGAKWFPDARLSFAENCLRRRDDGEAVVFWNEKLKRSRMSYRQLYDLVSRIAQALSDCGVRKGDRVAGYLPNLPESIAALLAVSSLGAIWSSCSPDFGVQGALDRFGQIEPKVLFACDGYYYGGKEFQILDKVREISAGLPGLLRCVIIPYIGSDLGRELSLESFIAPYAPRMIPFERVEFDHPLYILYSSGTTGVPKCIVHGTGGTLLQHVKEHRLHSEILPGDRLFYFTTLGWMMWNWLASGLASGAVLMLYDGSPAAAGGNILFDFAQAEGMTHFGVSAKFIDSASKMGLRPRETHDLSKLRAIFSTGSPLSPESFDYVYGRIKQDVCLSSISGGTDIVSCFVLGNPMLPVWRGEIQCKGLGMAVDVFGERGEPLREGKGELVCTRPFPSMPVGFWNDPDGRKYRAAYFETYPNVWRHGDWCEITEHGGIVIYGRSDAVLNPGGVRIGTAEIYRQVERLEEIVESLVIGQDWENDVRIVLFVKLKEGSALDRDLSDRIKKRIKDNATPRHVPAVILQVPDIPRTKSGKIVELAVRDVVHGRPVKNLEALSNPGALDYFRNLPELSK